MTDLRFKLDVKKHPWWSFLPPDILVVDTKSGVACSFGANIEAALLWRANMEMLEDTGLLT